MATKEGQDDGLVGRGAFQYGSVDKLPGWCGDAGSDTVGLHPLRVKTRVNLSASRSRIVVAKTGRQSTCLL